MQSSVLIGSKGELVLARSIDYGGKMLSEALTAEGALENAAVWGVIRQGDEAMIEICRDSLARMTTEVRNSIGFFEGQHEESITRVFVSGGLAHFDPILQILSDGLGLPCEIWDPLENCEVTLSAAKREMLPDEFVSLSAACGAAFEYLRS
jgi:Tfp pilus assembly PilM family ATPase